MDIGLHTYRQTEKNLVFYLFPFTILLSPFLSIVCPELWCLFTYSLFVFVTNMSAMSVVLVSLWLFFSFSLSFMRFVHCGYFFATDSLLCHFSIFFSFSFFLVVVVCLVFILFCHRCSFFLFFVFTKSVPLALLCVPRPVLNLFFFV